MHTHRRNSVNNNSKGWLKFGLFMSKRRGREGGNGTLIEKQMTFGKKLSFRRINGDKILCDNASLDMMLSKD